MRIDQVLPGVARGDAITNMALELRSHLRKFCESDIYAEFILSEELRGDVFLLEDQRPDVCVDASLFHVSYGRPAVTSHLLSRREPLIISFHNFSPADAYLSYNPDFAVGLELGQRDLERFRDRVVFTFADSDFNAKTLELLGYSDIRVVPLGLQPSRLKSEPICAETLMRCGREFPRGFVLVLTQLLPHKRIDQVVSTSYILSTVIRSDIPFVIVGSDREVLYSSAVRSFLGRLPRANVTLYGSVNDSQLATLMRQATLLFGMSDHEGLCVPPLEAMSMGLPVVIKSAGAVPETVGDGALLMPENTTPALAAEYVEAVWTSPRLRHELINAGYRRVKEFESNIFVNELIGNIVRVAS